MASKFALVIANTEYQDASFAKLTAPGKDAEEFAQVLQSPKLAAFTDVQILLNEGEGKTRRAIARFFADRKPADLLLLYFSGHGVRNEQGQLFLAANDTEISILEATGVPAEFITRAMNNSRSQRQVLILDCCNSGAFAHGTKSASGVGKSMGIATAFEGDGYGRVVLTATDATQFAWEGDKIIGDTQKSVFTHFLIEGLKGEADRNGDGRIHVDELYDYAYEQVVRRTPKQTPGKWSYKQQGDIILRENLKPREVKPVPLPPDLLELLLHPNSGVRKVGVQDLISLLEGKHLGLARTAEEKLREMAANDDSLTLRKIASDTLIAHGFVVDQPTPVPVETPPPIKVKSRILPAKKTELEGEQSLRPVFPVYPGSLNTIPWRSPGLIVGGLLIVGILIWSAVTLFQKSPTTTTGKDGMVLLYIPAGEFKMGNNNAGADEQPVHDVFLDAFWIDKTEVTNSMYAKCVAAGACTIPDDPSHYEDQDYKNHPVAAVTWDQAAEYCEWTDRRLPTEAEWEKAARGTDQRTYPWGNESPSDNLLNYNGAVGDTKEVGLYPDGASPYGALDMAGNVWEWIADWHSETYYASSPASNPLGPDSGQERVLRGGSWIAEANLVRSTSRGRYGPTGWSSNIGFRCVLSGDEPVESTPLAQAATKTTSSPATSQPTKADTPTPAETSMPATPTLGISSAMVSDKDGMMLLYVPAGKFIMGNKADVSLSECQKYRPDCRLDLFKDEEPPHEVYLDPFWIDQTEVTIRMYFLCVETGVCQEPISKKSVTHSSYYGNAEFNNYPVIYVDWSMAKTYCEWADRRLPTEAEWEKAARGPDGNIYPWGNTFDGTLVNFCDINCPYSANKSFNDGYADVSPVASYPSGKSIYGALDMAGNVWEWVNDWYSDTYYASSPTSNPSGPDSGQYRVLRGGSWFDLVNSSRSSNRLRNYPPGTVDLVGVGFRCALSATP